MAKLYKSVNGKQVRNDNGSSLTVDQMRTFVPSIFATEAHEDRSTRFAPVSTFEVLTGLKEEGFEPFFATQTNVRDDGRREFTKHMLRLRDVRDTRTDGLANEIILLNANDGTSAFQVIAGQFRFVCANGLVMGNIERNLKVHHKGDARGIVIDGVYSVVKDFEEIEDTQNRMKTLRLNDKQRNEFATSAYYIQNPLNFADILAGKTQELQYDPASLLMPQRPEDNHSDLFSTFNVVQERMIKGGVKRFEGRRTQAVSNINKDISMNTQLWNLSVSTLKDMVPVQY